MSNLIEDQLEAWGLQEYMRSLKERSSIKLSRSESEDTCSIASSSSINSQFKNHKKMLKELLCVCESSCGKKILEQTRLTSSDRNKLCHLIIDKLLCKSKKITSEQFQEWAAAIASVFKYENTSTYYVPSNTKFRL
ncbi:uncharacterized protein LOC114932156 [Nylanderia fulva]|uniref:uncharacterized protein LOC114932156 n=1 Tax=Nylanderia fulva TaxID=613905 RepID=UPI0010FB5AAB|nr:uncharacterized protein LOC114932156 [Nylanderia fulva]